MGHYPGAFFKQTKGGFGMGLKSILIVVVIALAAVWASNHVSFVKNIVG